MMRAGAPATTLSSGTSSSTTALAATSDPVADGDRSEHAGAGSDGDVVADDRLAAERPPVTQGHVLVQGQTLIPRPLPRRRPGRWCA